MKILSLVPKQYYDSPGAKTYEYVSFVEVLREMGHTVHSLDHILEAKVDKVAFNDLVLSLTKTGGYDLMIVVTYQDELLPEVLDEISKKTPTLAWNSDDDWRWKDYSSKWIKHYSYAVTTYRDIYEANKTNHKNLILSQWGCTGFNGFNDDSKKKYDMSFVGMVYGKREKQIRKLRKNLGRSFEAFGKGVKYPSIFLDTLEFLRVPIKRKNRTLDDQSEVKEVWNSSLISFTPLDSSKGESLQIKARVFDMGLSNTVMLATRNPALEEFYEVGKEYMDFETIEECIDISQYLLKNDTLRDSISRSYYERTKSEHLFKYRFQKIFETIGLNG